MQFPAGNVDLGAQFGTEEFLSLVVVERVLNSAGNICRKHLEIPGGFQGSRVENASVLSRPSLLLDRLQVWGCTPDDLLENGLRAFGPKYRNPLLKSFLESHSSEFLRDFAPSEFPGKKDFFKG